MPGALSVASDLASLTGCEAATLAPSTLHLFTDVFRLWAQPRSTAIYADETLYRTGVWGIERAMGLGMCVNRFRHHDAESLRRALRKHGHRTTVVATDGYCPCCGQPAPIPAYLECLSGRNGWLLIDDTQALGILGRKPSAQAPLGLGGGGIMRWFGIRDPRVILISSLAKAFGAPMAFLAAARSLVQRFEQVAETRVHCSPVAAPALHAAEQAIAFNEHGGDRVRGVLAQLILRLRGRLERSRLRIGGATFPAQSFPGLRRLPAEEIHRQLAASGIQTVLQRSRTSGAPQVAILLTARHTARDIDRLSSALLAITETSHA
jgi:8-amino-7-oxononanoate synthase